MELQIKRAQVANPVIISLLREISARLIVRPVLMKQPHLLVQLVIDHVMLVQALVQQVVILAFRNTIGLAHNAFLVTVPVELVVGQILINVTLADKDLYFCLIKLVGLIAHLLAIMETLPVENV